MLLLVYTLALSTEVVIMMVMAGIFVVALASMALYLFSYVRNSKKQMDALKRNVSALYVRQTQAATVKSDTPRVLHEKPDFRAMMRAQDDPGPETGSETAGPGTDISEPGSETDVERESEMPAVAEAGDIPASEVTAAGKTAEKNAVARIETLLDPQAATVQRRRSDLSDEALVQALRELIEKNLANPDLSIAQLASELCMSRSGLFAKIKAASGDTPNNMLSEARLTKARELLEEGKRPINEIGYMVGYSTPSYFSRCFLKRYGMTPHAWMARKQSETSSQQS